MQNRHLVAGIKQWFFACFCFFPCYIGLVVGITLPLDVLK